MYRLLVTGDLMIGEKTKREREAAVRSVRELMVALDVNAALGNLEVPLTNRGHPSDKLIAWRSPPSIAGDLKKMGFTILSVATNHALDYGVEGLFDTMRVLRRRKEYQRGFQAGNVWPG
jgi:poly-gamma-glutamate synthesis protein (capsule biosynthesis protein)